MKVLLSLIVFVLLSATWASPSVFPENAAYVRLGYAGGALFGLGGEVVLPVSYVDMALGAEGFVTTAGRYGVQLDVSALFFPALGTNPPTAVGAGADMRITSDGFALHLGPIVGTDLLFISELPMTLSLYAALGFDTARGFDPAWALQVRYYFDEVALEFASTDTALLSVALRYLF